MQRPDSEAFFSKLHQYMIYVYFIAGLVAILTLWIVGPYLYRKGEELKLASLARKRKAICLTFDDGPGEKMTACVLDLLDEFSSTATFFVLERRFKNGQIINRIMESGHEIGCHSSNHLNAWFTSPFSAWKDIKKGLDKLEALNIGCSLVRPPYGKITLLTILQLKLNQQRFGWWTIDSTDTKHDLSSPDSIIKKISSSGGGVILLHDFDQGREPERVEFVLETTRRILEFAKGNDYQVVTLSQLLRCE